MKGNQQTSLKRWIEHAVILFAAALIAWFAYNAADYWHFRRAMSIAERISDAQWRQLVEIARRENRDGHVRWTAWGVPGAFRSLGALSYSGDRNYAQISLYSAGTLYVFLSLSLEDSLPRVILCDSAKGRQRQQVLWSGNTATEERFFPRRRIGTLTESTMHSWREWILLPDEIRVIDHIQTTDGGGNVPVSVRLTARQSADIARAFNTLVASVPSGCYRNQAIFDGSTVRINPGDFPFDGERAIEVSNCWISELDPLLSAISSHFDEPYRPRFKDWNTGPEAAPGKLEACSWERIDEEERALVPAWCLWRKQNPHANEPWAQEILATEIGGD